MPADVVARVDAYAQDRRSRRADGSRSHASLRGEIDQRLSSAPRSPPGQKLQCFATQPASTSRSVPVIARASSDARKTDRSLAASAGRAAGRCGESGPSCRAPQRRASATPSRPSRPSSGLRGPWSPAPPSSTLEEWQRQLDIMLTGAFLCTKAAVTSILAAEAGGSIFTVSSRPAIRASRRRRGDLQAGRRPGQEPADFPLISSNNIMTRRRSRACRKTSRTA